MTNPTDPSISEPDAELAKAYRHLRLMRALFRLDDPELERALTLIAERLAEAGITSDDFGAPAPQDPPPKSPG
jgi:hypothetical protein